MDARRRGDLIPRRRSRGASSAQMLLTCQFVVRETATREGAAAMAPVRH